MADKLIITVLCLFSLTVFGQNTEGQNLAGAVLDSSQLARLSTPESLVKPMNLWKALRNGSNTHIGLGISPGYNNTTYFKIQKRIGTPNLPFGVCQTIEYATEHNLPYNTESPLFRMPTGAYYHLNEKWTVLVGVDALSKVLYSYKGIRKEIALCYQWSVVPITVGYSFFMGPSVMIGIPVF
jgi:hypothetical protein